MRADWDDWRRRRSATAFSISRTWRESSSRRIVAFLERALETWAGRAARGADAGWVVCSGTAGCGWGGEGEASASREAPGVSAGRTHRLVDDAPFLWVPPAAERVAEENDADGSSSERVVDGAAFVTWKDVDIVALAEFDDVTRDVLDGLRMAMGPARARTSVWLMAGSMKGSTCVAGSMSDRRAPPRRILTILSTPPCLRRW